MESFSFAGIVTFRHRIRFFFVDVIGICHKYQKFTTCDKRRIEITKTFISYLLLHFVHFLSLIAVYCYTIFCDLFLEDCNNGLNEDKQCDMR